MKIKFIIPALFLAFSLGSCSDSEESLRKQYVEACASKDFDSARAAVEKIATVDPDIRMDEHGRYVNDKEIYHLLARQLLNQAKH